MRSDKGLLGGVVAVVAVVAVIFAIMYGMRLFSNATTPITVSSPEQGVKCASMVTGDGAAISCWKVDYD